MSANSGSAGAGAMAVFAKLGGAALGIAVNVVLARVLGPEDFGRYALGIALGTMVAVLASGGMPFGAIRFLPDYLARGDFGALRGFCRASLGLTVLGGTVCAVAMLLGASVMDQSHLMATVLPWAAWIVMPAALAQSIVALLQARGHVAGPEIVQSLVRQGATLALVVLWFGFGGAQDFRAVLALAALAVALAAVVLWARLQFIARDEPRCAAEMRDGLRLWLGTGGGLLTILVIAALNERVDLFLLGWLSTPAELGIYSAAVRVAAVGILVLAGLGAAYTPRISAAWAKGDRDEVERLCREGSWAGTALVVAMTFGAFGSGAFVLSLFGPEFGAGATVLTLLLGAQIAVGMTGLSNGLAIISGNSHIALAGVAAGLAVNVVTGFVLIPLIGMTGAAMGVVAGFAVSQIVIGVWCSVRLGLQATLLPLGARAAKRGGGRHA